MDTITSVRPSSPLKSISLPETTDIERTTPLAPSPTFIERRRNREETNDDLNAATIPTAPTTPRPRRPDLLARGLSLLRLPAPDFAQSGVPLSPKLQTYDIYMQPQNITQHSPATSLPRHSRGLDFSRACTTLHHSTLADKNSPDSSPIITQRAVAIPGRKLSMSSMALDSPGLNGPNPLVWGASLAPDRSAVSSSLGSVNMMVSESENSSSDDDASMGLDDNEDPMLTTPQVHKLYNPQATTPFNPSTPSNSLWGNAAHFSPAQNSLMKTMRRTRIQKNTGRRSRKGSSSASNSGYSSMASPRTTSPPPLRSIETTNGGGGYFTWANVARSRRESLALGTEGMNLSSGNDSGDEASQAPPTTPGVVRRPVTRRGNLLPKTKGFARIRAALAEEATPVDTDVRREAETIKQVRERDGRVSDLDVSVERPQAHTPTAGSSPTLLPAVPECTHEDFGKELDSDSSGNKGLGMSFAAHASRNSAGMSYWNRFDFPKRTPPPPSFGRQGSVMSDNFMDSPTSDAMAWRRPRARSSASEASEALQSVNPAPTMPAVSDDVHLQKFKRRREDDIDIATIKRRAVSPGMSSQNSPILTNSPSQRDSIGGWGQPPDRKDRRDPPSISSDTSMSGLSQLQSARSSSGGSSMSMASGSTVGPGNLVNQGKKLGLQPMADTNDGLMKMTIE